MLTNFRSGLRDTSFAPCAIRFFNLMRTPISLALAALFVGCSVLVLGFTNARPVAAAGGTVVVTGLSLPAYVAVDGRGNLYVVDQGCTRPFAPADCNVYKETLSGGTYTPSIIDNTFTSNTVPEGVAVDASGNVYIGVFGVGLYKETPSGQSYTRTLVGCADGSIQGVAVDAKGYIYFESNGHVFKETATDTCGTITPVAGGGAATNLVDSNLAVDACLNVYVHHSGAPSFVWKETPSAAGYVQSVVTNADANGLAVDSNLDVYVSSGANTVYVASPGTPGYSSTIFQSGLTVPAGLAVDAADNVYIVEQGNNRVWKVPPTKPIPVHPACPPAPPTNLNGTAH